MKLFSSLTVFFPVRRVFFCSSAESRPTSRPPETSGNNFRPLRITANIGNQLRKWIKRKEKSGEVSCFLELNFHSIIIFFRGKQLRFLISQGSKVKLVKGLEKLFPRKLFKPQRILPVKPISLPTQLSVGPRKQTKMGWFHLCILCCWLFTSRDFFPLFDCHTYAKLEGFSISGTRWQV